MVVIIMDYMNGEVVIKDYPKDKDPVDVEHYISADLDYFMDDICYMTCDELKLKINHG